MGCRFSDMDFERFANMFLGELATQHGFNDTSFIASFKASFLFMASALA